MSFFGVIFTLKITKKLGVMLSLVHIAGPSWTRDSISDTLSDNQIADFHFDTDLLLHFRWFSSILFDKICFMIHYFEGKDLS